ncbi:MAG TPA: CapA family protein [Acidimicrobiales bacterium]|nr:CapA family protein [Acidimicrobiales bacterium]
MPAKRQFSDQARRRGAIRTRAQRRRQIQRRRLAVVLVAAGVSSAALIFSVWPVTGGSPSGGAISSNADGGAGSNSAAAAAVGGAKPKVNPNARITIAAVGDTMMGSPQFGLPAAGGRDLFSATAPYLKADVSIVDQEGTLTDVATTKCTGSSTHCFAFASPPNYAANLTAAGFNVANLANNHTDDAGPVGLDDTVAALTRVHLPHTGLPGQFALMHVGKVAVAVLGFAPYDWCADSLDLADVRALVQQASRRANVVVAYFHAGAQGADETNVGRGPESVFGDPQGDIRQLTHTFVDAGADLVIGTGPHVLRGIQFYKGKMIDYSLGNFLGYRGFALGGNLSTSAVLQATVTASGRFVSARLRPVQLDRDGVPSPGGSGISLVKTVSTEDFGSSAAQISASGAVRPPT